MFVLFPLSFNQLEQEEARVYASSGIVINATRENGNAFNSFLVSMVRAVIEHRVLAEGPDSMYVFHVQRVVLVLEPFLE